MAGQPDTRTPGDIIAGARRQRGLSVEDLAERTKIPPTMIKAIEADEYHLLSGPLYVKSFLRSCAKELGLVTEEILDLYVRHSGEVPRPAGEPQGVQESVRIRRVGLPWLRLSAGALGVAAVVIVAVLLTRQEPAATGKVGAVGANAAGWTDEPSAPPAAASQRALVAAGAGVDAAGGLPVVAAGVPGLAFSDGLTWPLVVRLRLPAPIPARTRRDGDEPFVEVAWPTEGAAEPVPASGIEAGRAYLAGDGLVVYWGAVERLDLVLGSGTGVELAVNGQARPLALPTASGEIVMELRATAASPLP